MRAQLLLVALLLGCATAEQPKEPALDSVPVAVVNEAMAKLREVGMELVRQRDEARDEADELRKKGKECDAGRRT